MNLDLRRRYHVLDAIRIVLALTVVIGHAGVVPLFGPVDQPNVLLALLARWFRTLVFGPPAVIAFFLISGFCIHYPFAAGKARCPFLYFYVRRYLRILSPVICTVVLFKAFFPNTVIIGSRSILWASTLWSIVCEEIYYAIYPILNRVFPQLGWPVVLVVAFGLAVIVIWWSFLPAVEWLDIGIVGTAVTLFPVWLLGCYLAEQVTTLDFKYSTARIWRWRCIAWLTMWIAIVLHFHTPIHQTCNGVLVGVVYYFWIRAEIAYYKDRHPWRVLVWGGRWSYSLYLVHPIVIAILVQYRPLFFQSCFGWLAGLTLILLASYGFYLFVERPSHNFARKVPLIAVPTGGEKPAEEGVGV